MIKLVVFDLDGVLVDSKDMHFQALNDALGPKRAISYEDHLKRFDGLPTTKKLEILEIPEEERPEIILRKQEFTESNIKRYVEIDSYARMLFDVLEKRGIRIFVASNSLRKTTRLYLSHLGLMEYVEEYLSNQDVANPKPHPEIYLKAMTMAHVAPEETLIVEDSHVGLQAAIRSGAHVMRVDSTSDVTIEKVCREIDKYSNIVRCNSWNDEQLNILIPMAGEGSRFTAAGYTFPKPLIDIKGKPMIQWVVESLGIQANYIYLVRKEHYEKFSLQYLLNIITPGCKIVVVDRLTEGAACTTLLAREHIDNGNPLMIANSDQFIEWNAPETMYRIQHGNCDGAILTFESTHPQWSYAKVNEDGLVTEVREKQVVSNLATVGIYYYKRGHDYVAAADRMIEKNIRHNREFYVAPVFNEMIADGKAIRTYNVDRMWGLGTPELLQFFLENHK